MPQIEGIIPAIGTPVTPDERVDTEGLKALTSYMIEGGVSGLFVMGSMGGCCFFDNDDHQAAFSAVVEEAGGKVPVLAGISDTGTKKVIEKGEMAQAQGVDGVVVAPPYYFPFHEEQLMAHYRAILSAVDLPLYLYNVPSRTNCCLSPQFVERLSRIDGIVGIKDSSGDFDLTVDYIKEMQNRDDFGVYTGSESALGASILWGADGGVIGTNIDPRLLTEIYQAAKDKKIDRTRELQDKLNELTQIHAIGGSYAGYHAALDLLGICGDSVMRPVEKADPETKEKIRKLLVKQGVL